MAEPALDRQGVVPLVGEGVAAGVAQHVRVRLELQAGGGGRPPMLLFQMGLRPGLESRDNQLGDAVPPRMTVAKLPPTTERRNAAVTACSMEQSLRQKMPPPSATGLPTDRGCNLPPCVLRRRIDAEVVLTSAHRSTRSAGRGHQ
jgi:hypothetical protein